MEKIGFIGLGVMGLPIAKNILKAGYDLYVVSRSRPPIEQAISFGAKEASSPKELMEIVDICLTCLPNPQANIEIYEGTNGIIGGVSENKIIIDLSTVKPDLSERASKKIKSKGAEFLDAPISGGRARAEAGTLTIMCGGDYQTFERVYDLLKAAGDYVIHTGPIGSGNAIKLINNMLVSIQTVALSEAYLIGAKAGIKVELLLDILKKSSSYSRLMEWGAILEDGIPKPKVDYRYLEKDVGLAVSFAKDIDVSVELAELTERIVVNALIEK
jgi:3-hydroxyisobutyrate dehydrogenase/2-hydroxy-3-oxopropionate reductase